MPSTQQVQNSPKRRYRNWPTLARRPPVDAAAAAAGSARAAATALRHAAVYTGGRVLVALISGAQAALVRGTSSAALTCMKKQAIEQK